MEILDYSNSTTLIPTHPTKQFGQYFSLNVDIHPNVLSYIFVN